MNSSNHLDDAALFALAAPAAGEPEALPEHLSRCSSCARSLAEWKSALRGLGEEELGPIGRRSPEEWRAAEDATRSGARAAGAGSLARCAGRSESRRRS